MTTLLPSRSQIDLISDFRQSHQLHGIGIKPDANARIFLILAIFKLSVAGCTLIDRRLRVAKRKDPAAPRMIRPIFSTRRGYFSSSLGSF